MVGRTFGTVPKGYKRVEAICQRIRDHIAYQIGTSGPTTCGARRPDLVMLDMRSGKVGYAVLSFGGFLGMGEKLFAVPWNALTLDTKNKRFVLNVGEGPPQRCTGIR